ncbi:DUF2268 domain-containing putative Zn-dependent protease [Hymenobacter psoromatis]|uniref:DUF2268 domain-containing putative Zn-dependent protease n=1 Tax=Hymenobacter psoromatis TaxID=1484116 RepID=UPI001CC132CB|nr:DUF2268 domain-containing putative Zn-dependent protease [Hymenobacter psoromatis]
MLLPGSASAQASQIQLAKPTIFTQDITNFWQAYDSVRATPDTARQRQLVQRLYLDRATPGLRDFAKSQEFRARSYVRAVNRYPRFWASVRPATLAVSESVSQIKQVLSRFQQLYPSYKPVEVFFTIGALNSGGTVKGQRVLIGTEIAAATAVTDATELGTWLQGVFKNHANGVTELVAHEAVHTQQPDGDAELDGKTDLLGYCLQEGAADFIAELLLAKPYTTPYLTYGRQYERTLWQEFEPVLSSPDASQWLYNGDQAQAQHRPADLGYFIGYAICRAYYQQARNKRQAVADIIELRHDFTAPHEFLAKSGYAARWQ